MIRFKGAVRGPFERTKTMHVDRDRYREAENAEQIVVKVNGLKVHAKAHTGLNRKQRRALAAKERKARGR